MAVKNHTLPSDYVDQDDGHQDDGQWVGDIDQDESPAVAKWPGAGLRQTTSTTIERSAGGARRSIIDRSRTIIGARSNGVGADRFRPTPDRVSDLLRVRIGVRDCAPLLEVFDRCLGLFGGQHPGCTLRFDRTSEVRAKPTANEFPTDAESRRDRFRAIRCLRIDPHVPSLRCVRLHDPIKAHIRSLVCVRSFVLHTHYIVKSIDRLLTNVRSCASSNRYHPPSAHAKEELRRGVRSCKSEAGWPCDFRLISNHVRGMEVRSG